MGSEVSWCPPTSGRGLMWNWTQGGETAVQPCPGGASGWARRPCDPLGLAGAADLSECRSMWLSTLTSRAHIDDAVLAVAHDLASVTGSRALYGGDVTATVRILNSLARRMANDVNDFPDINQREAMVTELVNTAVATGSNLMGGQHAAWADLRPLEHRAAATTLLLGLEETAFLLANNLHHEKTVRHAETNIRECVAVLSLAILVPIIILLITIIIITSSPSSSLSLGRSPEIFSLHRCIPPSPFGLSFIRFSSPSCIY